MFKRLILPVYLFVKFWYVVVVVIRGFIALSIVFQ